MSEEQSPEEEKRRKSQPQAHQTETDPVKVAEREALNGLRQYDYVVRRIREELDSNKSFRLRPSEVQKLNRLAVEGLDELPGSFRPGEMSISHSRHNPPSPSKVPEYVDDLCDYVNENWHASAWHLAAYVMWRLNWIHPFQDGNGRTSRALSYLVLCIRLGIELPGRKAIPDFIAENKKPYYEALDAADVAAERGEVDVQDMESLLQDCLAEQLASFHGDLTQADVAEAGKATEKPSSETKLRQTSKLHHAYNKYPFWFWAAGILVAVILTLLAA